MTSPAYIETTANIAISATFNGDIRKASPRGIATDTGYAVDYSYFNAHFNINQVGTCKIQGTNDDGHTWFDCASSENTASLGLSLQVPVTYKAYRAVFVNGVVGTTLQSITTSFI